MTAAFFVEANKSPTQSPLLKINSGEEPWLTSGVKSDTFQLLVNDKLGLRLPYPGKNKGNYVVSLR